MSDPLQLARSARENLARGLGALQGDPSVPPELVDLAAPIAQAMGALHQIERSQGAALMPHAETALNHVRTALSQLQTHTAGHPAVDAAMEAVAGSLGNVHALHKLTQGPAAPQPPAPAQPVAPQPARSMTPALQQPAVSPLNSTAVMDPPALAPIQPAPARPPLVPQAPLAPHAPLAPQAPLAPHAAAFAAPDPFAAPPAPQPFQPPPQQPFQPQPLQQQPLQQQPFPAQGGPGAPGATAFAATQLPPEVQRQTAPSLQAVADPFARRPSPVPAAVGGQRASVPVPSPPVQNGAAVVEAALGAHSATNFYKGLSGNDIIDHGGLFVATYMVPKIGASVRLKISLPGGYEFEANGVVKWARDATDDSSVQPGFGAKLTELSPEARQLVYRYVRNREPLFHDDF